MGQRIVVSAVTLFSALLATAKDYQPMNPRPCEFRVQILPRAERILQAFGWSSRFEHPAPLAHAPCTLMGISSTFPRYATRSWATQTGRFAALSQPLASPTFIDLLPGQVNDGTQAQTTVFVNICNNVLNPPQVRSLMASPRPPADCWSDIARTGLQADPPVSGLQERIPRVFFRCSARPDGRSVHPCA